MYWASSCRLPAHSASVRVMHLPSKCTAPVPVVQRMFTCPLSWNVRPAGRAIPVRSTVYGVGESDPAA